MADAGTVRQRVSGSHLAGVQDDAIAGRIGASTFESQSIASWPPVCHAIGQERHYGTIKSRRRVTASAHPHRFLGGHDRAGRHVTTSQSHCHSHPPGGAGGPNFKPPARRGAAAMRERAAPAVMVDCATQQPEGLPRHPRWPLGWGASRSGSATSWAQIESIWWRRQELKPGSATLVRASPTRASDGTPPSRCWTSWRPRYGPGARASEVNRRRGLSLQLQAAVSARAVHQWRRRPAGGTGSLGGDRAGAGGAVLADGALALGQLSPAALQQTRDARHVRCRAYSAAWGAAHHQRRSLSRASNAGSRRRGRRADLLGLHTAPAGRRLPLRPRGSPPSHLVHASHYRGRACSRPASADGCPPDGARDGRPCADWLAGHALARVQTSKYSHPKSSRGLARPVQRCQRQRSLH